MESKRSSRRQFLRTSALWGTAGALGGCATQGMPTADNLAKPVLEEPAPRAEVKRRKLGPKTRIRCGFVGVGNRGSSLLQSTLGIENVEVVAVCDTYDVWRDRAVGWCKRKYENTQGYVRFEEMIAQEKLDAVVIATPDHLHAPVIMEALGAGLDVYTEKPMTLTWQDAEVVDRRVNETGAVLQVGTQLRSMPMYQKAREVYQAGSLGKLMLVQVNRHMRSARLDRSRLPEDANEQNVHWDLFVRHTKKREYDPLRYFRWRQFADYSNGYYGDLMLHHLDLCHFITGAGMPATVMGLGGIYAYDDGRTLPDTVSALLEYPERFHFNYTTTVGNGHYGLVERYLFTEGTIEVLNMAEMTIFHSGVEEKVPSEGILNKPHLEDFFACMRTRKQPIAPVSAGVQGAACTRMALESSQTGQALHWEAGKGIRVG